MRIQVLGTVEVHQDGHNVPLGGPTQRRMLAMLALDAGDVVSTDRLIDAIRREYDRDAQRDLAHRLHRRIADLQPYTFLFAPRATRLLDRKIVMIDAAGHPQPVRAGGAGDLFFYFNRWQRLARDPEF